MLYRGHKHCRSLGGTSGLAFPNVPKNFFGEENLISLYYFLIIHFNINSTIFLWVVNMCSAGSLEHGEYSSIHEGEVPLYLHIPPNITLRLVTENGTKEQQQSTKILLC